MVHCVSSSIKSIMACHHTFEFSGCFAESDSFLSHLPLYDSTLFSKITFDFNSKRKEFASKFSI